MPWFSPAARYGSDRDDDASQDSASRFDYEPLQSSQLRLLRLQMDSEESELRCVLSNHSLEGAPPYLAISYCWGDSSSSAARMPIYVGKQPFLLLSNAWWALRHFRRHRIESYLWMDAICIDQTSIEERNSQVRLMDRIFAQALEVLVWLGLEDDRTGPAFASLEHDVGLVHSPNNAEAGSLQRRLETLRGLLEREYWSRIWVIQEIAMAQSLTIYCGRYRAEWEQLEEYLQAVEVLLDSGKPAVLFRDVSPELVRSIADLPVVTLARTRRSHRNVLRHTVEDESRQLLNLVRQFWQSKCSDPRDRLYGLVGLTSYSSTTGTRKQPMCASEQSSYRAWLMPLYHAFTTTLASTLYGPRNHTDQLMDVSTSLWSSSNTPESFAIDYTRDANDLLVYSMHALACKYSGSYLLADDHLYFSTCSLLQKALKVDARDEHFAEWLLPRLSAVKLKRRHTSEGWRAFTYALDCALGTGEVVQLPPLSMDVESCQFNLRTESMLSPGLAFGEGANAQKLEAWSGLSGEETRSWLRSKNTRITYSQKSVMNLHWTSARRDMHATTASAKIYLGLKSRLVVVCSDAREGDQVVILRDGAHGTAESQPMSRYAVLRRLPKAARLPEDMDMLSFHYDNGKDFWRLIGDAVIYQVDPSLRGDARTMARASRRAGVVLIDPLAAFAFSARDLQDDVDGEVAESTPTSVAACAQSRCVGASTVRLPAVTSSSATSGPPHSIQYPDSFPAIRTVAEAGEGSM